MFSFLQIRVTDNNLKDLGEKWNWNNFDPSDKSCDNILKTKSLTTLIKMYKFAESSCKSNDLQIKGKATHLLEKLTVAFGDKKIIEEKVKSYLMSVNESIVELGGRNIGEIKSYNDAFNSYKSESQSDIELGLKLSDLLELSRTLKNISGTCYGGVDDSHIQDNFEKIKPHWCKEDTKAMAERFYKMIVFGPKIFDLVENSSPDSYFINNVGNFSFRNINGKFISNYEVGENISFGNMAKRFIYTLKTQAITFSSESAKNVSKKIIDYLSQFKYDKGRFCEMLKYFCDNKEKIHDLLFDSSKVDDAEQFIKDSEKDLKGLLGNIPNQSCVLI